MKIHAGYVAMILALTVAACHSESHHQKLGEKLGVSSQDSSTVDYVIRFARIEDAKEHSRSILEHGGAVHLLDDSGRIQRVTALARDVKMLAVADDTMAALNTPMRLTRRSSAAEIPSSSPASVSNEDPTQSYMTARDIVGVSELRKRFPSADGRATKVAVFDTGIDFGIEGLSASHNGYAKLAGFYDLSAFGRTTPDLVSGQAIQESYEIRGHTLRFSALGEAKTIEASGVLEERQLARDYLVGTGVDLNENGTVDDIFPYVLGQNRDGRLAVWIDINRDGLITSSGEMLTDFNTTQSYVLLRPESSPSGARPLAVTIESATSLQFHVVLDGHGSSCGIIIGGDGYANGRLEGMAPKTQLLSYVLDATGQDVYTIDQFVKTFLHAKAQGVDAISISWGFATADLASARFVQNFLDEEIAGAGIIVGIAAGNEGPGLTSATPDDYIPRNGFAVGAFISKEQARSVYGWVGYDQESVIWYSSVGPTRGGRIAPNVVSPLMTLVRGHRELQGPHFYGFGGTSSATPALIGATTALISVLKDQGLTPINARLFKLAIQEAARPLANVELMRQGSGLINVNQAYDLYLKYSNEWNRAKQDPLHRTPFPYELRAETSLENNTLKGEGIHLRERRTEAKIKVSMSAESRALIDEGSFVDILTIRHLGRFLEAPESVTLQPSGFELNIVFDQSALAQPGVYQDVLQFVRRDGSTLLSVPVVIEIPAISNHGSLARIEGEFSPYNVWRQPVQLKHAGTINFEGLVQAFEGGENAKLVFQINGPNGTRMLEERIDIKRRVQSVNFKSDRLPAGNYEILAARSFGRPAVLKAIRLSGVFHIDRARVEEVEMNAGALNFAIRAHESINVATATLVLEGQQFTVPLTKDMTKLRPGFYGSFALAGNETEIKIGLSQSGLVAVSEPILHMELSLINRENERPVYRGWVNLKAREAGLSAAALLEPTQNFQVVAYPNIVRWESLATQSVRMSIETKAPAPEHYTFDLENAELSEGQLKVISFNLQTPSIASPGTIGTIKLLDASGDSLAVMPFTL